MKHLFFTLLAALLIAQSTGCTAENRADVKAKSLATIPAVAVEANQVIALDEASFAERVFDFKNSSLRDPRMLTLLGMIGIPAALCLTGFLHYMLPLLLTEALNSIKNIHFSLS